MTTLTTVEAAALYGVGPSTIRRRIRAGLLPGHKAAGGRYLVAFQDDAACVAYLSGLLSELRRQRADLERQIETQQREIERGAQECAELKDLLRWLRTNPGVGRSRSAGDAGTASFDFDHALQPQSDVLAVNWVNFANRGDKKNLGASLVVTGVAALVCGIVLHLALRTHAVDSAVHLGYMLGLIGLLLLLIGLLVVY